MIIHKEIQKLFQDLSGRQSVSFNYDGVPLTMSILDHGSQFQLTSSVYKGGNYIPASVRQCLTVKGSFPRSPLKTALEVDEEHFEIFLHYQGAYTSLSEIKFHNLLEDFNTLADEWRMKLDEKDRNDLIHVRVK